MVTNNPHFKVAPNAPKDSMSAPDFPVELETLASMVGGVFVVFLIGVLWFWMRLKKAAREG